MVNTYVAVTPITLGGVILRAGDIVPPTVRRFQKMRLNRRNKIGPQGFKWTNRRVNSEKKKYKDDTPPQAAAAAAQATETTTKYSNYPSTN